MSRAEWLRTFVAVYRTGSVTVGARSRGLTQPAASQQLAALSRAVGGPVMARTARGVVPTERGRELYAQVAEPLDRLEGVLVGLDGGRVDRHQRLVRIGASAELFEAYLLPRLVGMTASINAHFDDDPALLELLLAGELDVAVTATAPGRRTVLEARHIGDRAFALVAAPGVAPRRPVQDLPALADWLRGRPWVSYSRELPVTRRLFTAVIGRPFDADLRLVAPDLRAVVAAVELELGVSLLPMYVCARELAEGRLVSLFDVSALVPPEPWFAHVRRADAADAGVNEVMARLLVDGW